MLNLVFLLDITGSMGSELEGVKKTVGRLVKSVFDDDTYEVMVTVITFTENGKGCYVTNHSFTEGTPAVSFVSSIQLCVPPGSSGVNANGGDGDENHKAALAQMLLLDNTMPTIAFLISDAGPHLVADRLTPEAGHEVDYLKINHSIVNTDIFNILGLIQAHFQDNLILNVIKYTKNSDHTLYGAIAKQFHGVLITPQTREADKLAAGLMAILTKMFESFAGNGVALDSDADHERALRAFEFYDVHDFALPSSEADVKRNRLPTVGSTKDALFELIERATVIVGNKFVKRAIEATDLPEQVELLLVIAKCLTKSMPYNVALDRATVLVHKIRAELPEENQGHFKIHDGNLPLLLSQDINSTATESETVVSAITLMSTEETAKSSLGGDGDDEEKEAFDPRNLIQTAGSLFMGHLAVMELPVKNGKVDFMDSWSAVINKVSNDVMTASDFLTMIGDEYATNGLSVRANEYNYAQVFADPHDAVGSALLRVASGTQVLDIITGLLAGAPAGQFSPNMFRGTISACLMALISQHDPPLSKYQWDIIAKLVHSIRLLMGPKPKEAPIDPESPMPKLLFRLLRSDHDETRVFLQEMLATRIQKFHKYDEPKFLSIVETMVGYDNHDSVMDNVFESHALDAASWQFNPKQATKRIAASDIATSFRACATNALRSIYGTTNGDDVPTLAQVWPSFEEDLPKYVLLHKRTARYSSTPSATEPNQVEWNANDSLQKPLDDELFATLAMQLLRKKHNAFLRELHTRRQDAAAEARRYAALKTMQLPMDEFVLKLSTFSCSSCQEHKLLLEAFKRHGHQLSQQDYEAKLQVVITGRRVDNYEIVFNRGNLHPHPDKFVPMSDEFKTRLRLLRRERSWCVEHTYRPSDKPNHSGHCNSNPSEWAKRRSTATHTFWN
ncbi:hypothetical protein FI667_g12257, partial [Globisporangium splendens]